MSHPAPAPVDERLPWRRLFVFGLQHVLVMAASPIASVFLMSKALSFPPALAVQLLSATFVICGLGTLLQSLGKRGIGARLPFVMLPGGAPIVLFILIAQQTDVQTAAGAVILTGVFYFLVLPVFRRCLRYFPPVVVGTMLLLVAINLAQVSGKLVAGHPAAGSAVDPLNLLLAFATIACTVAASRWLRGMLAQLAILLGLLGGAVVAGLTGAFHLGQVSMSPVLALPTPFPFGWPTFDVVAAIPLMVFAVISMVEATGQTLAISDAVGRPVDQQRDVPRTIRGDALTSLLGGMFGTSLIITSGENIGIVRATGVRSRFVTAMSGAILVAFGLLVPVSSLISAIPEAVVGGTGLVVFCIVGTMGIDMLRKVDLRDHANMYVVAVALAVGLLPILVPGIYGGLPSNLRILVGNGVAMGAITAALLNFLFFHTGLRTAAASAIARDDAAATH
ncbi:uracil-xanthine permease family protein [Cupriavidus sp. MP-37]|uniref:uracil-xanthine permease family protein n=1 Tax=Cupriavidus sp. MP-37 TaxID=2884455 RepID=UPI001D0B1E3A|nr:uracil-xanthine permease family protein [Cupriavidus sp. MP-37]UDM53626.1 uracil-xanthine permease family protein [Cupriavidus sp. MP-37]